MWELRRVTLQDKDKLFAWRNDPKVYRYLFHPAPVELSQHELWLKKTLENSDCAFYIAKYEQQEVGTVRYDFNSTHTTAEIGIYLASEFQGKGLGTEMMSVAESHVKAEFKQLKKIIAKVLVENISSEKMFLNSGYKKTYVQLEKEI